MRTATRMLIIAFQLCTSHPLHAYTKETHQEIAQRAADPVVSSIDQVLKTELDMPSGIGEIFHEKTVQRLIGDGARYEDMPPNRVLNHFHNPLAPWAAAGLYFPPVTGLSSVVWQQSPAQNSWSWQDARQRYIAALTSDSHADREQAFVDTFQTLGHLTHLVQDAASPAHTRNDPHLKYADTDGYEAWVEQIRITDSTRGLFLSLLNSPPVLPPQSIFTPTSSSQAPVPIARLIDTDQFEGLNGAILTSNTIGMAEYTNGNFVSDDTIFLDFLLPRPQSLNPGFFVPEGQGQRRYFSKVGAGEQVDYFVAEGVWWERLQRSQVADGDYILTDRVYRAYAQKLLPRAVGYSAALLDYFFRGQIDFSPDPSNPLRYLIRNRGNEDMKGTFALYYDDQDGNRHPAVRDNTGHAVEWPTTAYVGDGVLVKNGGVISVPTFQPPTNPPPAVPDEYILVFHGEMGEEKLPTVPSPVSTPVGAVMAKKVSADCSTPFMTPAGRVSFNGAEWSLDPDPTVQYGNVDWVGVGCRRVSWLGPFGRYVHMRHTSQLSRNIFSGGKVLAVAPGPVVGAAIQSVVDPPRDFLLAVVAEVDDFGRAVADTVYATPVDSPNSWVALGSFATNLTPLLPEYPVHYFFNASGTQAVSVKRLVNGLDMPRTVNPWRAVILDVSVLAGQATFTLGAREPLDATYTITGNVNFPPYTASDDLNYIAHTVAADYRGDQRVNLHLHVEEHHHESGSGDESFPRRWTLETSTGWVWELLIGDSDLKGTGDSWRYWIDTTSRGLVHLDLRFDPPVVIYEELQVDYHVHQHSGPDFVSVIDEDEAKGKLAWRIGGEVHNVYGFIESPHLFGEPLAPNQEDPFQLAAHCAYGTFDQQIGRLYSWGPNIEDVMRGGYPNILPEWEDLMRGWYPYLLNEWREKIGTFAVGGSAQNPQLLGAYKTPRIQSNFMYPEGDLDELGGGPVGY